MSLNEKQHGLKKLTTYLEYHNTEEQEQRRLQTQQPSVELFYLSNGPKRSQNVFSISILRNRSLWPAKHKALHECLTRKGYALRWCKANYWTVNGIALLSCICSMSARVTQFHKTKTMLLPPEMVCERFSVLWYNITPQWDTMGLWSANSPLFQGGM